MSCLGSLFPLRHTTTHLWILRTFATTCHEDGNMRTYYKLRRSLQIQKSPSLSWAIVAMRPCITDINKLWTFQICYYEEREQRPSSLLLYKLQKHHSQGLLKLLPMPKIVELPGQQWISKMILESAAVIVKPGFWGPQITLANSKRQKGQWMTHGQCWRTSGAEAN